MLHSVRHWRSSAPIDLHYAVAASANARYDLRQFRFRGVLGCVSLRQDLSNRSVYKEEKVLIQAEIIQYLLGISALPVL